MLQWGEHGQLGLGKKSDVSLPERIEALNRKRISQLSAGYYHSVALSETVSDFLLRYVNLIVIFEGEIVLLWRRHVRTAPA